MKAAEWLTVRASQIIPGVQAFRDVHDGYPPYHPVAKTVGSVIQQVAAPLWYESNVAHRETHSFLPGMDFWEFIDKGKLGGTVLFTVLDLVYDPRVLPAHLAIVGIMNVAEHIGGSIRSHFGENKWRYRGNNLLSSMR